MNSSGIHPCPEGTAKALSQQTVEAAIRRYRACLTACPCILPSPSLTGWTADWGCDQRRCSLPRHPCRCLLSCGVRRGVESGVRKRPPCRMTSRLTLRAIRPKLTAFRLATSHLFRKQKSHQVRPRWKNTPLYGRCATPFGVGVWPDGFDCLLGFHT